MQKSFLIAALLLCLATQANAQTMDQPPGYQTPSYQQPAYQPPPQNYPPQSYQQPPVYAPPPVATQQFCQPYSDHFTIAGETRITRGTACLHPDGSWELHPQELGMRYISNGSGLIFVPVHPFAVGIDYYHHHHHNY